MTAAQPVPERDQFLPKRRGLSRTQTLEQERSSAHVASSSLLCCRHPVPADRAAGPPVRPASADAVGRSRQRPRRSHPADRPTGSRREPLIDSRPAARHRPPRARRIGRARSLRARSSTRCRSDSAFAHISADAPVVSDMAITNKVTGASAMWQGTSGLLGLLGTPGYDGTGIGVAVVDSGISPHTALDSRVIARVNLVSWEGAHRPATPTATARTSPASSAATRPPPKYVTPAFAGGSAPGVKLIDVRVLGATGVGYTSDVIAGIDWAVANRARVRHPRHQSVARPRGLRTRGDRSALPGGRARGAGRRRRRRLGRQLRRDVDRRAGARRHHVARQLSVCDHGRRDRHRRARLHARTTPSPPTVRRDRRATTSRSSRTSSRRGRESCRSRRRARISRGTTRRGTSRGRGKNAYFRLTGTSMSTAVVSGGVALLLDANPFMTPGQVKIALQMGATFMPQAGLVASGAGSVNFPQSQKVSATGLVSSLLNTVDGVLGTSSGATFRDTGTLIDRDLRSHRHPSARPDRPERALRAGRLRRTGRPEPARAEQPDRADSGEPSGLGRRRRTGRPTITSSGATASSRRPVSISCGATRNTPTPTISSGVMQPSEAVIMSSRVSSRRRGCRSRRRARVSLRVRRSRRIWRIPLAAYLLGFTLVTPTACRAEFLIFAALTLLSGRFTLKVPSVEAHFSPSEMFVVRVGPALRTRGGRDHAGGRQRADRVAAKADTRADALQLRQPHAVGLDLGQAVLPRRRVKPLFSDTTSSSGD